MPNQPAVSRSQRAVQRVAALRPVSWLLARTLHRLDGWMFRRSGGRRTAAAGLTGLPVVMLTTTGARSGQARTVPVVALPTGDGDRALFVVASNFGQRHHPAWYHNLRADPRAWVAVDGRQRAVRARELAGDERDRRWEQAVTEYPGWAAYARRASHRSMPVLLLEPLDGR